MTYMRTRCRDVVHGRGVIIERCWRCASPSRLANAWGRNRLIRGNRVKIDRQSVEAASSCEDARAIVLGGGRLIIERIQKGAAKQLERPQLSP
eukprot:4525743-Prymnesium_polylepis.1